MSVIQTVVLACLAYFAVGASVGFLFRRRVASALIFAPLVALAIPIAADYFTADPAAADFATLADFARGLINGLQFAAAELALLVCLPALAGALAIVVAHRRLGQR